MFALVLLEEGWGGKCRWADASRRAAERGSTRRYFTGKMFILLEKWLFYRKDGYFTGKMVILLENGQFYCQILNFLLAKIYWKCCIFYWKICIIPNSRDSGEKYLAAYISIWLTGWEWLNIQPICIGFFANNSPSKCKLNGRG